MQCVATQSEMGGAVGLATISAYLKHQTMDAIVANRDIELACAMWRAEVADPISVHHGVQCRVLRGIEGRMRRGVMWVGACARSWMTLRERWHGANGDQTQHDCKAAKHEKAPGRCAGRHPARRHISF